MSAQRLNSFEQEHWDSACDRMPQAYVDKIVRQTLPSKVDDGRPPFSGSAEPSIYSMRYALNQMRRQARKL